MEDDIKVRKAALKCLWSKTNSTKDYSELVANGLSVNDCLGYNSHPCSWAARDWNFEWMRYFVEIGVHPGWISHGLAYAPAISDADRDKAVEFLSFVIKDENFLISPRGGSRSVLESLMTSPNPWLAQLILDSPLKKQAVSLSKSLVLRAASKSDSIDVLHQLLIDGADPSAVGWGGNTPLHLAAAHNNFQAINLLIQFSADFDAVNSFGETPLWRALETSSFFAAEALLENGANPDFRKKGRPPLAFAISRDMGEMVKLLLDFGADSSTRSGQKLRGRTMFKLAEIKGGASFSVMQADALSKLLLDPALTDGESSRPTSKPLRSIGL